MARKATAALPRARAGKTSKAAAAGKRSGKGEGKPVKKAFAMIGRNDLMRLLEQASIFQNRIASQNGSLRELIGDYSKKKNLHTGAYSIAARLWRLGQRDPQALWLLLAHFDDMREKMGLDRMAKAQGQLLPAISEGEPNGADADTDEDEGNVVNYPAAREVEERAGAA